MINPSKKNDVYPWVTNNLTYVYVSYDEQNLIAFMTVMAVDKPGEPVQMHH